jgi:DNA-directed RNA polymerase specialized sigma24 family protein
MDKKKAINLIEHHLRSYKTYEIGIKNLQKSLDDILPSITTNYTLREGTNGSFDITSKVEMAVLDRLEGSKAIYLKEQIRELQTIISSINIALEALGENDRRFVQLRFIEGYNMDKVAQDVHASVDNCFKIRNRIMDKLLISLRNIITVSVQLL